VVGAQRRQLSKRKHALALLELIHLRVACCDDVSGRQAGGRRGARAGIGSIVAEPVALCKTAPSVFFHRQMRGHPSGA
jgi:hypothetical protein